MDLSDATNPRPGLRQPFIETANALAGLYKQAVSAERDARDAGSRAAYMRLMQWAARKSRTGDRVTPMDIVNFCATELAQLQAPPPERAPPERSHAPPLPASQGHAAVAAKLAQGEKAEEAAGNPNANANANAPPVPKFDAPPVAFVAKDEALVSDIKKLNVNPRKRQRVDISDTFVRACRSNNSLIFADNGHVVRSPDSSMNPIFFEAGPPNKQSASPSPRREGRDHARDALMASGEYQGRKAKNSKAQIYDKLRKK